MVKTLFWIVLGVLIGTFIATFVFAADVTLSWEKPNDARVVGYNVFVGTEKPLPAYKAVDGIDTCSVPVTNLLPATVYIFMVKSRDASGGLSAPSEYVHYPTAQEEVDNFIVPLGCPGTVMVRGE